MKLYDRREPGPGERRLCQLQNFTPRWASGGHPDERHPFSTSVQQPQARVADLRLGDPEERETSINLTILWNGFKKFWIP